MEKFEDIRYSFKSIRNTFCENIKDQVGASIDAEQLEPYEQILNQMMGVGHRVKMEVFNIDRLLIEARVILPRI